MAGPRVPGKVNKSEEESNGSELVDWWCVAYESTLDNPQYSVYQMIRNI